MKILAIDCAFNPGTKGKQKSEPAYCLLEDGKMISSEVCHIDEAGAFSSNALTHIRFWIIETAMDAKPDWIIIERPYLGKNPQSLISLASFFGVAREAAYFAISKEPFTKWMASTVRSILRIEADKARDLKEQLREWIIENTKETLRFYATDDELDAYLLGLAFWRKLQDATFDPLDQDTARQKKIKARKSYVPFVTLCAKEKADLACLDSFIAKWHRRKLDDCELHEYLGLSKSEYAKWLKAGEGAFVCCRNKVFEEKIDKLKARLDARKARKEARKNGR